MIGMIRAIGAIRMFAIKTPGRESLDVQFYVKIFAVVFTSVFARRPDVPPAFNALLDTANIGRVLDVSVELHSDDPLPWRGMLDGRHVGRRAAVLEGRDRLVVDESSREELRPPEIINR